MMRIDHIELFVPDRDRAAEWYSAVLGLKPLADFAHWAKTGPLMLSGDGGATKLALFVGPPQADNPIIGWRRVAFGVDGPRFIAFLRRLADTPLYAQGKRLLPQHVVDHGEAFSIYFQDPFGNPLELTTYDHAHVHEHLPPLLEWE